MLTNDDLRKMQTIFATKADLQQFEINMEDKLASKGQLREYAAFVEQAVVEAKEIRDEQSGHSQRHDDLDNDLRSQNSRLKKIESLPSIALQLKKK